MDAQVKLGSNTRVYFGSRVRVESTWLHRLILKKKKTLTRISKFTTIVGWIHFGIFNFEYKAHKILTWTIRKRTIYYFLFCCHAYLSYLLVLALVSFLNLVESFSYSYNFFNIVFLWILLNNNILSFLFPPKKGKNNLK